ncbi:uncharacterized protein DS421_19g660320 [Arachis hypogaea]|uniref:Uncharacterized protein n=1 Tax=Arachis hypogaea TaxID=3818 RepID=A0A6B9VBH9_ARAHY|nr:uncharacterized protein DS421_19g660320 [Arachis hypogaea]
MSPRKGLQQAVTLPHYRLVTTRPSFMVESAAATTVHERSCRPRSHSEEDTCVIPEVITPTSTLAILHPVAILPSESLTLT